MSGNNAISGRNMTNITNNYNVSPQLVQTIAAALSGKTGGDLNKTLAAQFGGAAGQGLNTGNMAQAHTPQPPAVNMQAAQTMDIHQMGKAAQKQAKSGYPVQGLSGVLVEEGVGKTGFLGLRGRGNAKKFENRLKTDSAFRQKVEARVGGKFIADGKNDGKITFAPFAAQVPGVQATAGQVASQFGQTGGTVLSGISQMQGNALNMMLAMQGGQAGTHLFGGDAAMLTAGGAGAAGIAGLSIASGEGGFLKKLGLGALSGLSGNGFGPMGQSGMEWKLRQTFGMTKSQGGPGSRVAQLPPGASFEDIVAAFMVDVIDDMQKEAMAKMNQIRKSINSQNSLMGKVKGAMGGVLQVAGGAAGLVLGGPLGAMAGSAVGGAVGGALGPGADADSRNLMFEELKNIMQKLQQMLQALSNVLNTMHQGAMNSIRNIRA